MDGIVLPAVLGANIDFMLMDYDLEANGIDLSTITEATVKLEMRDTSYNLLNEAEVTLTYQK